MSTIQFVATLQAVASELRQDGYTIFVPQVKPLSPGNKSCFKAKILYKSQMFSSLSVVSSTWKGIIYMLSWHNSSASAQRLEGDGVDIRRKHHDDRIEYFFFFDLEIRCGF